MTSLSINDPSVVDSLSSITRTFAPRQPLAQPDEPGFFDTLGAAFRQENLLFSLLASQGFRQEDVSGLEIDVFELFDPEKPFDVETNPAINLVGFEGNFQDFIHSRSLRDIEETKDRIRREIENRKILSDSGLLGITSVIAASILDPLVFVPVLGVAAKGAKGVSVLRAAARVGASGFALTTVQEAALQATQVTRTGAESALNIAGATILSGILGGAVGKLTAAQFGRASKQLDDVISAMGQDAPGARFLGKDPKTGKPRFKLDPLGPNGIAVEPLGSGTTVTQFAEAAASDLPIKQNLAVRALNAIGKWISPRLQLEMSKNKLVRIAANNMITFSTVHTGGPKAKDAEILQRLWMAQSRNSIAKVDSLYVQYVTSNPKAEAGLGTKLFGTRAREGKLSKTEFNEEIAIAMRGETGIDGKIVNVDTHAISQVQDAARLYRKEVFDPLRDMAIELGILPKEILDNPGYLTRLYNHDLLRTSRVINGVASLPEQAKFIDAVVEFRLKRHIESGKPLTEFNDAGIRKGIRKALDQILEIPDGRLSPADAMFRGPMFARTFDVPDHVIAPWLSNDLERIVSYYTRGMSGDLELIKRFGLQRVKPALDEARSALVSAIRAVGSDVVDATPKAKAKAARAAGKLLSTRDNGIVKEYGGKRLNNALKAERGKLVRKLRRAKTDKEAIEILEKRDTDIIKRFSSGSLNLLFDRLRAQAKPAISKAAVSSEKLARKLQRDLNRDIRNLKLARDMIRGTHGIPADPTLLGPRFLKVTRQATLITIGGTIALSSIPDVGLPLFNKGFFNGFRNALIPFISDLEGLRYARAEAEAALGPAEYMLNSRSLRLYDVDQDVLPRSGLERALQKGTQIFSLVNLSSPWNQFIRNFSALTTNGFIIENAIKVAAGKKLSPKIALRLQEFGFDDALLKKIAAQYDQFGGRGGRRRPYAPNTGAWTDPEAVLAMRVAAQRVNQLDLIRGGPLDRPIIPMVGPELSKTIFMFMNFGLSANTRILTRGLQYADATTASSAALSIGMGMLAMKLKDVAAGREPDRTPLQWVAKGIEQSGVSGALFDFDRYLDAATSGKFSTSALFGTGRRFYSPESTMGALFGPAIGHTIKVGNTAVRVADFDIDDGDIRRLRRLIPLQNHFLLNRLFNQLED